jgi:hypothetical protein
MNQLNQSPSSKETANPGLNLALNVQGGVITVTESHLAEAQNSAGF